MALGFILPIYTMTRKNFVRILGRTQDVLRNEVPFRGFRGSVILNAETTPPQPRRIFNNTKARCTHIPRPLTNCPPWWIAVDKLSSRLATLIYKDPHRGNISIHSARMTNAGSHLVVIGRKHAIIIVLAHAYIHGFPTGYRFVEIPDIICISTVRSIQEMAPIVLSGSNGSISLKSELQISSPFPFRKATTSVLSP
jgi:hypothetical protein